MNWIIKYLCKKLHGFAWNLAALECLFETPSQGLGKEKEKRKDPGVEEGKNS